MSLKSTLMALSVIAAVQVFGGNTAFAESATTKEDSPTVTVKVQSGDTLSSIAESHGTTFVRLFNANESIANPDVINVDQEIRIPKAEEELEDRYSQYTASQVAPAPVAAQPVASAPAVATSSYTPAPTPAPTPTYSANSAGNTYAYGWCTWYVKSRKPNIPNSWGNAYQWTGSASASGYSTGSTPVAGAIGAAGNHVVYVESVNGDMVTISEMAYAGGVGVQHFRTVPSNSFYYIYA